MMMEKHDFISAHKSRFPVSRLCDLLDVSKSWFYERPQTEEFRQQKQHLLALSGDNADQAPRHPLSFKMESVLE